MIDDWIAEWRRISPLARGGICLECRSLVGEGEACHGRPATTWARWAALRARTPAKTPRRREDPDVAPVDRRLRGFGLFASGMALVSGMALADGKLAGLFGLVLAMGGAVAAQRFRRRPARDVDPVPEPGGVPAEATLPEPSATRPALYGRVTRGDGDGTLVAFEERAVLDRPGADVVFARFGSCAGGALTLDDGRQVELPAGRVWILDESGHTRALYHDGEEETRLDRLELRVGDRVTLVADLEPEAPAPRGYRDPPPARLRVVGVATIGLHAGPAA